MTEKDSYQPKDKALFDQLETFLSDSLPSNQLEKIRISENEKKVKSMQNKIENFARFLLIEKQKLVDTRHYDAKNLVKKISDLLIHVHAYLNSVRNYYEKYDSLSHGLKLKQIEIIFTLQQQLIAKISHFNTTYKL